MQVVVATLRDEIRALEDENVALKAKVAELEKKLAEAPAAGGCCTIS